MTLAYVLIFLGAWLMLLVFLAQVGKWLAACEHRARKDFDRWVTDRRRSTEDHRGR